MNSLFKLRSYKGPTIILRFVWIGYTFILYLEFGRQLSNMKRMWWKINSFVCSKVCDVFLPQEIGYDRNHGRLFLPGCYKSLSVVINFTLLSIFLMGN